MNILRPKLRSKIIFTVISIMVYSGIIIVWYLYRFTLSNFVTINKRLFEINTENIAKSTYDEMDETLHTVKIVSLDKSIINYLSSNQTIQDPEVAEQLNLYKKNSDYGTLSLLSATGTVIMSTDNSYVGRNLAFREYFKSAQAGRPDVSLAFGVVTKKPSYYFSSPVFDNNGRFIGVVAAIFDSSKIDKLINIHSDDKQILMLVDKNGIVLSSSKPTRVFNSLGKLPDEKIVEIKK